ncbi:MAG: TolC family protein [Planctomyces sp.]|nr:TolC family protein [Planctomyces sp.]
MALESIVPPEPVPAATAGWSVAELEQLALTHNPSIARAAALVCVAQGEWTQVGLPPNPVVGYEGQQLGSQGRAEQHGILFSQEFVRGGKLRLNRCVAAQQVHRAQQELAAQQQRVLTDVRIAFARVLIAQEQIRLTSRLVDISGQMIQTVNDLIRGLEASRADLLQAELESENAELLLQNAINRHDAAWRELASVVGLRDLPPGRVLRGDIFAQPRDFDFEERLLSLQSQSPEVGAAAARIQQSRFAYERALAEPIPNLTVQGLYNVRDNGIGGDPDAGVSVSIPVPLFDRNQGGVSSARFQISAAEQELQQLQLNLRQRLAGVFERYASSRSQVERYQQRIIPRADESLSLTRRTFDAGETSYLIVLTAQRTYFQTSLAYLESLETLRIAEAELEGFLLRDSLEGGVVPRPGERP